MSIYYIYPNITVNDLNFKEIMDNMTNNISNLFVYNKNLIEPNNYNYLIDQIIYVVSKFLKIYNFFDYDKKNIYIDICNSNINVIMNIHIKIYKSFYTYQKTMWEQFYNGIINKSSVVYNNLDLNQKQELRISLINGNFYMYDNIKLELPYDEGIILKKKSCTCENINNCNFNYNYIIIIYW
jgi:hypothetical protein